MADAAPVRCVLCGAASTRTVWHEAGYEGRACACGTVYVDPEPPPGAVDFTRDLHPDSFYALPAAAKVAWLARHRPPSRGRRLLEVGCGEGHFLAAARDRGYEVAAIEPHADRAARVQAGLGVPVACEYIEATTLPPASFDVVYHCDLLSHFPAPVAALKAMKALLRPGGALCFEAGIHAGFSPVWYRLIGSMGYPMHRWFYTTDGLRTLLDLAGLRVEAWQRFGLAPYVLASDASRVLRKPLRLVAGWAERRSAAGDRAWLPTVRDVDAAHERFENFMRYRVARFAPGLGPQTLWVIAVPDQDQDR